MCDILKNKGIDEKRAIVFIKKRIIVRNKIVRVIGSLNLHQHYNCRVNNENIQ